MNRLYPCLKSYAVAVLAVVSALLVTLCLQPLLGSSSYPLFFAAVAVSAWYGGMGPGLLAALLSVLAIDYCFIPPLFALAIADLGGLVRLNVFVLVTLLISSLNSELHKAKRNTEESLNSLLQSETRFSRLAESNIIGVIVADMNGEIIEANDAFLNMVGYTREDLRSRRVRWRDMTPPEYRPVSERAIQELRESGVCTPFEKEYIHKNGSRVPVLIGSAFLGTTREKVIGFVLDIGDRKQAEKERGELLRREQAVRKEAEEAREQIFKTLESITDGFMAFDREWRFTYVNQEAAQTLGRPPEALLGKNVWEEFPELSNTSFGQLYQQAMAQGVATELEDYYPPFNAWFAVRAYPSEAGLALYFQNITARKQSEDTIAALNQKLQRRVSELQTLFDVIPIGIAIAEDPKCTSVKVNPSLARLLNISPDANASMTPPSSAPKPPFISYRNGRELREEELPLEYAAARGEEVRDLEIDIVRDDGTVFNVFGHAAPLFDEDGNPRGAVGAFLDISDRKQAEEALRYLAETSSILASSLDYEATLERVAQLPVPHIADWCSVDILTEDGSIRRLPVAHADPAKAEWASQLQHYAPDPNGANPIARVLKTGCSELLTELPDSLLVAATRDAEHLRIVRELGAMSVIIVPLVARQRILGTISLATTESRRRYGAADLALAEDLARRAALAIENARVHREVQEANRMKDEFLATLSHELRTPLNAMLGWTQLLLTRKFNEATAARALETIDRNTRSLAQLIEDILDVSRIIQGKLSLNARPMGLVSVIEAAIETVTPAALAKGIQIESRLEASAGLVLGDANRLQQVVWNLLSNAVKFTPKGGRVEVRLASIDSQVQIRVSDTGQGIQPEFLPYIFERFRQADSTSTRSHGGLGLGLAIVRHLVELHGGTVCAQSLGIGRGTTFIVTLPRCSVSQSASESNEVRSNDNDKAPAIEPLSLDGLRVLVVDDETDARELLSTILSEYGAQVKAAASASEALAALANFMPQVLVSDIAMPHEDGYALIRQVRRLDAGKGGQIPAVALTAYARAEDRKQALLAGFQLHLPKPVDPVELAAVVANLAGRLGVQASRN